MLWVIIAAAIVIVVLLARASTRHTGPTQHTQRADTDSSKPPRSPERTHDRQAPLGRPDAPRSASTPSRTYTQPRQPTPTATSVRDRMPFASPGMKGHLFTYGGPACRDSREHTGSYAVIDVETTGLAPSRGDRVIEIAVARVDAHGRIEDEFATLINPEGRDTGPVFIHGISNDAVAKAPTFAEVAPEILARLDGTVVVAHNAPFEERFLGTELARAGLTGLRMPALCTLWLGQQTFRTPNHKLGTLLSAEIQQRLLPLSRSCEATAFTLAGWLEPAARIGGDTFDYSLARDVLHLSLTDSMGHGLSSALTATVCVAGLRGSRRVGATLVEQAQEANASLHRYASDGNQDDFATGILGRVDLTTGVLELVNAGHVAPFLIRSGRVSTIALRPDLPLGMFDDTTYTSTQITLIPGDRIVFVTDGMLERNVAEVNLPEALADTQSLHPREAVRAMADKALEAAGHTLTDDATVLTLDWHGSHDRERASVAGADPVRASDPLH